jgi:hypothetical protein
MMPSPGKNWVSDTEEIDPQAPPVHVVHLQSLRQTASQGEESGDVQKGSPSDTRKMESAMTSRMPA